MKHYEWRSLRQSRGFRSKTKRVITQFSPHDFTAFKWEGTASFHSYICVVLLLAVFLAAELNPFYLKVSLAPPLIMITVLRVFIPGAFMDGTESSYSCIKIGTNVSVRTTRCPGTVSVSGRPEVGRLP